MMNWYQFHFCTIICIEIYCVQQSIVVICFDSGKRRPSSSYMFTCHAKHFVNLTIFLKITSLFESNPFDHVTRFTAPPVKCSAFQLASINTYITQI